MRTKRPSRPINESELRKVLLKTISRRSTPPDDDPYTDRNMEEITTMATVTNPLSHKAVLAALHISRWNERRVDRKVTDEVHQRHSAERNTGKYIKRLVSEEATETISSLTADARHYHLRHTLPWLDGGTRILPSTLYMDYAKEMQERRQKFDEAVRTFIKGYPDFVADAKKRMNGMFDEADYPRAEQLDAYFSFIVKVLPCPDAGDFRCELDKDTLAGLKSEAKNNIQDLYEGAVRSVAERVLEVVGHMAGRLKDYKPASGKKKAENFFRDSLVGNVRELVTLLPAFNMGDDAKFGAIIKAVEKDLCKVEAEDLRNDDQIRERTRIAAEKVLKSVNAFMA
jgi:hypothetical protein